MFNWYGQLTFVAVLRFPRVQAAVFVPHDYMGVLAQNDKPWRQNCSSAEPHAYTASS